MTEHENKNIEKHSSKLNWAMLSRYQDLQEDFIEKHAEEVDWESLPYSQPLSTQFIEKYSSRLNWGKVSRYQDLQEYFIEKHAEEVDWHSIFEWQSLSEKFIIKHAKESHWPIICEYQTLTPEFIDTYSNKIDWEKVSTYQRLPVSLIRKYSKYVYWDRIARYQDIPEELLREFRPKESLGWYLQLHKDSWHHKSSEEKRSAVTAEKYFECHKDYCIGYIEITRTRTSHNTLYYPVRPGAPYETWADVSDNRWSFGYDVYTRMTGIMRAKRAAQLEKVKVYYKDVARVFPEKGHLRCFRMTVIE